MSETMTEVRLEKTYWEPAKKNIEKDSHTLRKEWLIDFIRPAILTKTDPNASKPKLRRTAWLDGLRGFAAFLVYVGHQVLWCHEASFGSIVFENGWGYEGKYHFATFPGIRLMFCGGHFAVSVFFVISGYVLSCKPLSLIQSGDFMRLHENIASALFRRWLRLYIPLIVTTFALVAVAHTICIPAALEVQGTWHEEVWSWYTKFNDFSWIFRTGGEPWFIYNFHAWSIPVEFKGSIAIYTQLMAFSRCTRNMRLAGELVMIYYYLYLADGFYCALFTVGMLFSDLDLLALDNNLPKLLEQGRKKNLQWLWYTIFACAIYLGGVPSHDWDVFILRKSPGWYYLSFLKPYAVFDYKWFFLFWAATFILASVPRIPTLKKFFESNFCQYLGKISFSLYLVHGPVLWTFGERLYAMTGLKRITLSEPALAWQDMFPLSKGGPLGLEPAFLVPNIFIAPVTFWLAEMVTKLVDEPSVTFAQWCYKQVLAPSVKG